VVGVYCDDNCKSVWADFQACTQKAFGTYTAAHNRGRGDGRDSFSARKTCYYMTDALEVRERKHNFNDQTGVAAKIKFGISQI